MSLPGQKVELAFGDSGYFDVTRYVQSVSINRGINRVLDDFSAGSCSVTFVNNERIFDPTNGFPNLYKNYNFESNLDGWRPLGAATIYRGTSFGRQAGGPIAPYAGTGLLIAVSATGVVPGSDYVVVSNSDTWPTIVAGKTYIASAQNITYWATTVGLAIGWFTADGGFLGQSGNYSQPSSNTNWKEITVTGVAPVGAARAEIVMFTINTGGGFEESGWDYVTLREYSASQSPLFDLIKPGGKIRISGTGLITSRRFTGFIQDWDFTFADSGFDAQATVTALDFLYEVGNVSFLGGTQPVVQATSDRIELSLNSNSIGSAEFGYDTIRGGHTLVGYDENSAGDNLLSYIQNVARSEPADLYSDTSGFLEMKDRSFTNYDWNNTNRYNFVTYPSTATILEGNIVAGEPRSGWTLIGTQTTAVAPVYPNNPIWRGGTVADPFVPTDSFVGFVHQDYNPTRYAQQAWNNYTNTYTFAGLIRGAVGNFNVSLFTLGANGQVLSAAASTSVSGASTAWIPFTVTKTESSTAIVGGLAAFVSATGSSAYVVYGDGFIISPGTSIPNYFNGGYNPLATSTSASTAYEVAWSGEKYASQSGLLTSVATAVSTPIVTSFADANSQSAVGGTGIPFTDLEVVYGSDQLYNKVQVVGINTSAVTEDTALQASYGVRVYSQSDNLTTSQTKPAEIASAFLAEFKFPEYRASQVTVALESLTRLQQTAVLEIELRDVVRVAFKPSNTGSIVNKYYQVLAISSNTDVERDSVTFSLASLENLPFRLDSTFLGVLDTDTLA
jgi:hypothetical protein